MSTKQFICWGLGAPTRNGNRVKHGDQIAKVVDGVRVAHWQGQLAFMGDVWPSFQKYMDATEKYDLPHWLCDLHSSPGAADGTGWQRDFLEETDTEFKARVTPLLATGRFSHYQFDNECGVGISNQAERERRWRIIAEKAERLGPWLVDTFGVTVVMPGLYGIERWLEDGTIGASFNAWIIAHQNEFPWLKENAMLDLHTFEYMDNLIDTTGDIRDQGWNVIWGEHFWPDAASSPRSPRFNISREDHLADATSAGLAEVPIITFFGAFPQATWAAGPNKQDTSLLAVTGPGGNIRKGDRGEPDYLEWLGASHALLHDGEGPVDPPPVDPPVDPEDPEFAEQVAAVESLSTVLVLASERLEQIAAGEPPPTDPPPATDPLNYEARITALGKRFSCAVGYRKAFGALVAEYYISEGNKSGDIPPMFNSVESALRFLEAL